MIFFRIHFCHIKGIAQTHCSRPIQIGRLGHFFRIKCTLRILHFVNNVIHIAAQGWIFFSNRFEQCKTLLIHKPFTIHFIRILITKEFF